MNEMKEIEKYLPEGWREQAFLKKAHIRGRAIKTVEELLSLNLLH